MNISNAKHVSTTTLMITNKGKVNESKTRINIENIYGLLDADFTPGTRFNVETKPGIVKATISPNGTNVVSPKNHRRRNGIDVIGGRIDLRATEIGEALSELDDLFVYYFKGVVLVMAKPTDINNKNRIETLRNAVKRKHFNIGSLYSGVGSLDEAIHDGLADVGIKTTLRYAVDNWEKATTALYESNSAATNETRTYSIGIEELCAMGTSPHKNITMLTAGILCKGASKLNTKHRNEPEFHPIAGHQVLNFVMHLQATNFSIPLILIENVLQWADTVSLHMLKAVLKEQGYQYQLVGSYCTEDENKYLGICSNDYGDIDKRTRMAFLAYPKGISLNMETINSLKSGPSKLTVGDIRLPESEVDPEEYKKGLRLDSDARKAKGWKNRVVSDDANSTPTLSADCFKQRPEDAKFKHPSIEGSSRLPLPEEHCKLKGTRVQLINALPFNSNAQTAVGNGVAKKGWVAFGKTLGIAALDAFEPQIDMFAA